MDHKVRQYQEFSCQLCVHRACDVLITVVPYVFPVSSDGILKSLKNGIVSFWGVHCLHKNVRVLK